MGLDLLALEIDGGDDDGQQQQQRARCETKNEKMGERSSAEARVWLVGSSKIMALDKTLGDANRRKTKN